MIFEATVDDITKAVLHSVHLGESDVGIGYIAMHLMILHKHIHGELPDLTRISYLLDWANGIPNVSPAEATK